MNTLRINGELVIAQYLKLEKVGGFLQLLLEPATATPSLHSLIYKSITSGVTWESSVMQDEKPRIRHGEKEFSEIRVISGTVVWLVDHLRSVGFSVIEEVP